MIDAFLLHWLVWVPRTKRPVASAFKVTPGQARDELMAELRRIGARQIIVSCNIKLRQDGLPYAVQRELDDHAIAVYFIRKDVELCIARDRYLRTDENMRAIGKTIEALRGIEQWGTSQMVDAVLRCCGVAVFRDYAALPETTSATAWWEVLGVLPGATRVEIERAVRALAKTNLPDRGGNPDVFHQVQAANLQAKEAIPS